MTIEYRRYIRRKKHRRLRKKLKARSHEVRERRSIRRKKYRSRMFNIAQYFKHDTSLYPGSGLNFYVFDSSQVDKFVKDCLKPFREAYIEDAKLKLY